MEKQERICVKTDQLYAGSGCVLNQAWVDKYLNKGSERLMEDLLENPVRFVRHDDSTGTIKGTQITVDYRDIQKAYAALKLGIHEIPMVYSNMRESSLSITKVQDLTMLTDKEYDSMVEGLWLNV